MLHEDIVGTSAAHSHKITRRSSAFTFTCNIFESRESVGFQIGFKKLIMMEKRKETMSTMKKKKEIK